MIISSPNLYPAENGIEVLASLPHKTSSTAAADGSRLAKNTRANIGDILYIEPWIYHGLTNTGTEPLVLVVVRFNAKGI